MLEYNINNLFENDLNYTNMYYNNDSPEFWDNTVSTEIGDQDFDYKFSSDGFRCEEFSIESELPLLFLGCSMTLGLGLPLDNVWAKIIHRNIEEKTKLKIPFWNLAKNGSSIDLQFLLLEKYHKQLKPKFIFFLIPLIYRRVFYYQNWFHTCLFNEANFLSRRYPQAIEKLVDYNVDESAALFEFHKYMLLINYISKEYDGKIFYQFSSDLTELEENFITERSNSYSQATRLGTRFPYPVDRARDRAHHGPKSHKIFTDSVWEEIKDYF